MAAPTADQIIAIVGGPQLARGVVWRRPTYDKKERGATTITRPDVTPCATYFGSDGNMRVALADKLRIEWVDVNADGIREKPAIVLEGGRQNLIDNCDYEADIVGTQVRNGSTLVRDNAHALRGSWALKITTANVGTSGVHFLTRAGTRMAGVAGTTYSGSAWVYATGAAVGKSVRIYVDWFDAGAAYLSTGSCGAAQVLVAGWQRIGGFGVLAPVNAVTAIPMLVSEFVSGIWDMWVDVPQWEVGPFSSTAIPTTTASLTRAGDLFNMLIGYGLEDLTVLAQVYRPIHADAVGALGVAPGIYSFGGVNPVIFTNFENATRDLGSKIRDSAAVDVAVQNGSMPAGNVLTLCSQYVGFPSLPKVRQSVGVGGAYGAFSAVAAEAIAKTGDLLLHIGRRNFDGSNELFGLLFALIVARGQFTSTEMETWLN